MNRRRARLLLLNAGHFIDHLVMLVFASVAALALSREWDMSYGDLVTHATPGFVAFGVFSLPAGWLADRWSRDGMIAVFFAGVGAASMATSLARSPTELAVGLFAVGLFAAIYHPVGLALVYDSAPKAGHAIAVNGVWGNMGVASAALITGWFIDHGGWRAAFWGPGVVSLLLAVLYAWAAYPSRRGESARDGRGSGNDERLRLTENTDSTNAPHPHPLPASSRRVTSGERGRGGAMPVRHGASGIDPWLRVTAIVFFTTAVAGLVYQSTTFALPKVLAERSTGIGASATLIGWLTFLVFAIASSAQLIVGRLLDSVGPRRVFMGVAAMQVVSFALMPGRSDWAALAVALAFMLGAFGQIPINDYMIGRMASPERRASIYGVRFVVTFAVLGASLPFIAWVHEHWGFDTLFRILSGAALVILVAAAMLPERMPVAGAASQ